MKTQENYVKQGFRFHSLSLKDLLETRDAYHVFLTRKANVFGTAIGKYRFYKDEKSKSQPKTLENSKIKKNSYPCILVFVNKWIDKKDFGKKKSATYDEYIPRQLFLPDGREIPVCVLLAQWQTISDDTIAQLRYPVGLIGGGYPVFTNVQGEERWVT